VALRAVTQRSRSGLWVLDPRAKLAGAERTSKPVCIPRLDEPSVGVRCDPHPSEHTIYTTTFRLGRVATVDSVRVESESTSAARPQDHCQHVVRVSEPNWCQSESGQTPRSTPRPLMDDQQARRHLKHVRGYAKPGPLAFTVTTVTSSTAAQRALEPSRSPWQLASLLNAITMGLTNKPATD
jgi:hypothetical protein